MSDKLRYNGVFIYAVAQRLDCRERTSRPFLTLHGMMDEQFLVQLAEKVHRGQEGRALNGLQPGGRCYGYRNIPIEDPSRPAKYGRASVTGVKLEIQQEEAATVRRIFEFYAGGESLASITKVLNTENVPPPQTGRYRKVAAWHRSCVREMLRNERYRGVFIWNRTRKERNPENGRKSSRPRPESEWLRIEVPEWRIVSEELWLKVERQIKSVNKHFGNARLGGFKRAKRQYLFSGFLACGLCGSNMVIVSGQGLRGYSKYGCPTHRYGGACANRLMIRQDRLESQLLSAITDKLLSTEMLQYALARFIDQIQARLKDLEAEMIKAGDGIQGNQRRRAELKGRAKNLADAISTAGPLPSLLSQLAEVEKEIDQINEQLTQSADPGRFRVSVSEIQDFAIRKTMQLKELLATDIKTARVALTKHLGKLSLLPKESPEGPLFEVSGDLDILGGDEGVMLVVARDGIEPPTPAFSGLRSTD